MPKGNPDCEAARMTRIHGVEYVAARCCGATFSLPRYSSINFSAREYWTDGWREESLYPNDEGLRRCDCGNYLLIDDLVRIVENSGTAAQPSVVPDNELMACLSSGVSETVEVAARLTLWRFLNHPYRERYRQHRFDEDALRQKESKTVTATPQKWHLGKWLHKTSEGDRPEGAVRTIPVFDCSEAQRSNMRRLCELLEQNSSLLDAGRALLLAELHREQGNFEQTLTLLDAPSYRNDEYSILIKTLAKMQVDAPVRFLSRS